MVRKRRLFESENLNKKHKQSKTSRHLKRDSANFIPYSESLLNL